MDYETIIRYIILIGIVQGLLFNFFVFIKRKKFDNSLMYLNTVVLCLSLNNLREFVFDGDYFTSIFTYFYLSIPWHFLVVPMFYAFLIYYLKINDKLTSYLKFTYLIFIIESIVRISLILFVENFEVIFNEYMIIEEMFNAIYAIFIFYHIIKLMFLDINSIEKIASFDNLQWIRNILKFGMVLMVFWIIALTYYYFTRSAWVYDPLKISYSVLIYWLGYQGLIHSKVLNDRISLRKDLEYGTKNLNIKANSIRIKESNISDEKYRKEFLKIENYIIEQNRFLDPLISQEKLAEELKISVSQFSKLINVYSTNNFSDFINSLRIEQAKKLLSNDEFSAYTIVAIGLECGFNSKSTFYSAFKKFTSETPTAFRDKF